MCVCMLETMNNELMGFKKRKTVTLGAMFACVTIAKAEINQQARWHFTRTSKISGKASQQLAGST